MSYTKTTWSCGDTITADKLNNIEDGIEQALECCGGGSEPLVVGVTVTEEQDGTHYTLDETLGEIKGALPNVYVKANDDYGWNQMLFDGISHDSEGETDSVVLLSNKASFLFDTVGQSMFFGAESDSEYPCWIKFR